MAQYGVDSCENVPRHGSLRAEPGATHRIHVVLLATLHASNRVPSSAIFGGLLITRRSSFTDAWRKSNIPTLVQMRAAAYLQFHGALSLKK